MEYDIRQSQLIHTWPGGSMIDFPELSLIMLNFDHEINDWGVPNNGQGVPNKKSIIRDNRLAAAFKVDHFISPPVSDGVNNLAAWSVRFPRAHYCSACGLIKIINKDSGNAKNARGITFNAAMAGFYCNDCLNNQTGFGPKLIPMRFVIATEEGFLDDFPWDWFVHKAKPHERNKNHKLYFRSLGGSASLNDIFIESRNAGNFVAKRPMSDIFNQEIFTEICPTTNKHYLDYVKGFMAKPWKGWHNNTEFVQELISHIPTPNNIMNGTDLSVEAKIKFPRTMQKGAGNIIFPIVYSGIILPESLYEQECPPDFQIELKIIIASLVDNLPETFQYYTNDKWKEFFQSQVIITLNHKLNQLGYSIPLVKSYIQNYFGSDSSVELINKSTLLRRQEFKAFIGDHNIDDSYWFRKKNVSGLEYNNQIDMHEMFNEIILFEKLSALKVYKGFTRVKPLMNDELVFADIADNLAGEHLKQFQRIQDARKDPLHTRELPAVVVRGEGIFLRFNNQKLNDWSKLYKDSRLNTINNNQTIANNTFGQVQEPINKRYLFLHTFSHIILKELAEDCGYSLSSLAEIIYCSTDAEIGTEEEMNGILIYTTSSDSEGSLGGLVEKGDPKYFSSVIKKGVDKARWCSSDPLCISADKGQGFMGLNLAACYSCVLLPETCCEKMNKYLDRAAIIGTLEDPSIGFF